jgi:uncharacterized protein (TIGR02145 family)
VRAYAINSAGTFYGDEVSFTTSTGTSGSATHSCGATNVHNPNLTYGSMTDQDGNTYKTIVIGNQEWMAENLKTRHYSNGDIIPLVTDNTTWSLLNTGATCWFNNDSAANNCPKGKLYNWYAAKDSRNICPNGWHVSTDSEWNLLAITLVPAIDTTCIGCTQFGNNGKMQSTGYWLDPTPLANNDIGFSGFPAGNRANNGTYSNAGWATWLTTGSSSNYQNYRCIQPSGNLLRYPMDFEAGLSVRCIKDKFIIDCGAAINTGTLTAGVSAVGVSSSIPFRGGNGSAYNGESVSSSGVTGLTATLTSGNFAIGSGNLTYTISGTPSAVGLANFALNINGNTCSLSINVLAASSPTYPANSVFCANGPTTVVDVWNPATGRIWMDRNLGASQVATNSNDVNSFGDLYQWGRRSDGHQCRTSPLSTVLSTSDQPPHGDFIYLPNYLNTLSRDWRTVQNDNLWQGVNGVNNPCPIGYYVPTEAELEAERLSWITYDAAGAFASPLKFPLAGLRSILDGSVYLGAGSGYLWSSTVSSYGLAQSFRFNSSILWYPLDRSGGHSVRCIKYESGTVNNLECNSAVNNGILVIGVAASGVSSLVSYTGGNGGAHSGQAVPSTGVTGLTATLAAGTFANGTGSLTYTITGTPSASGTASFVLSSGGQSCTLNRTVVVGTIASLNCEGAIHTGSLTAGTAASGVTSSIPYTGGDGGPYNGQTVSSSNIPGLTATLTPGYFASGDGNLIYTISGTPAYGNYGDTVKFYLNIGGQSCFLYRTIGIWGSITSLNCLGSTITGTLVAGVAATGVSFIVPYTGGNGGTHFGQTVSSTGVTGLMATLTAGNFNNGAGNLTFTITGTPATNGTASFELNIGGQTCILNRTVDGGAISFIACNSPTNTGVLTYGVAASGVSSSFSYTASNGGSHLGQTVVSTGVLGLTATLAAGAFLVGGGSLNYTINGTPMSAGTASFAIVIGGQNCNLNLIVNSSVNCSGLPTSVVEVINPTTSKIWMDRNLGASQSALSSTDINAYGDLYQWGRRADGHHCRNSSTTSVLSSTDLPVHGKFILSSSGIQDWRSPQNNNLWQGVNGVNNPCPAGYRLPSEAEFNAEIATWSSNNAAGAFASVLKLTMAGTRMNNTGSIVVLNTYGRYWSSTINSSNARNLMILANAAGIYNSARALGYSVRCIKDVLGLPGSINSIDCNSATTNGTLTSGASSVGTSIIVPYTGGNGGMFNSQTVASTGVTGLSASLTSGTFNNGSGFLTYTLSGAPDFAGTASFALNIGGQSCSLNVTVNPIVSNPGSGVIYWGHQYPSIVLNNGQEWMTQNLQTTKYNDGTPINLVSDPNQWAANLNNGTTLPMMCWYNNDQATNTSNNFGALYNWYAVNPTTNGNRNICPIGWHLPTDADWNNLIGYIDPSYNPSASGIQSNSAGGKMKITTTQFWNGPNTGATNESGFSGLPGGYCFEEGTYEAAGFNGLWWSSTEFNADLAWYRSLGYSYGGIDRALFHKVSGVSVRCLKN